MLKAATVDFDTELPAFTIGNERVTWLGALIKAARDDYQPRNFGERHLVDDLAVSRWRILRVALMEKAVYDAQLAVERMVKPSVLLTGLLLRLRVADAHWA